MGSSILFILFVFVTAASKAIEDEIRQAEEKFCESKNLADVAMVNFLNADTEQIQALSEFISAELEYHRQAADIMETLLTSLRQRRDESAKTTKYEVTTTLRPPSRLTDSTSGRNSPYPGMRNDGDGSATVNTEPLSKSPMVTHDVGFAAKARPTPKCRALYDFEAMNSTELPFTEGQEITLIQQVDENWYEGEVNGNRGYFPVDYVEVLVPLP